MNKQDLMTCLKEVEKAYARSAWKKGVYNYAVDMADALPDGDYNKENIEKALLNGASDWNEYSYGGCALIYDGDIAKALCTPSEFRRKKEGELPPNSNETWLDVQTRALMQSVQVIKRRLPRMTNPAPTNA